MNGANGNSVLSQVLRFSSLFSTLLDTVCLLFVICFPTHNHCKHFMHLLLP